MENPFYKSTAHIEDWIHMKLPTGSLGYMIGAVTKHSRQEDFKVNYQKTSSIVKLDLEARTMETENTSYTLGKSYTENKEKGSSS